MASVLPRLHRAAARGEKGKLKQFLTAGDDVNARDGDGRTALLCAVAVEDIKCVVILLTAGADPSASDTAQVFPLYMAVQSGNTAIVKALLRAKANAHAIIDRPGAGTALSVAAYKGNQGMLKLLLDAACDTSKTATNGQHPLTIASLHGHSEAVTMLLDAGADVSAVGGEGATALIAGVQEGSCDIVNILLERGADVNEGGLHGRTALHMAARQGFHELINVLIAAGAGVDLTDREEVTPLFTAVYFRHANCVYALLRAGANVSARDHHASSPLHIAAFKGFTDMIEILLAAGAQSDVTIVKALLDRGANASVLEKSGGTVLHSAAYRGKCAGVLCALYRAGADPTVKDVTGKTAADYARDTGHEDAAKLLDLLAAKHRSMNST